MHDAAQPNGTTSIALLRETIEAFRSAVLSKVQHGDALGAAMRTAVQQTLSRLLLHCASVRCPDSVPWLSVHSKCALPQLRPLRAFEPHCYAVHRRSFVLGLRVLSICGSSLRTVTFGVGEAVVSRASGVPCAVDCDVHVRAGVARARVPFSRRFRQ